MFGSHGFDGLSAWFWGYGETVGWFWIRRGVGLVADCEELLSHIPPWEERMYAGPEHLSSPWYSRLHRPSS